MTAPEDFGELLREYRERSEHSLGGAEQSAADDWLLSKLRGEPVEAREP
jgi:hypothetical protein